MTHFPRASDDEAARAAAEAAGRAHKHAMDGAEAQAQPRGGHLCVGRGCVCEELERLRGEQRRVETQRLESLGTIAGGVAHQFNNLLTIIAGHAGLASVEAAPGSNLEHSLEEIRRATQIAAGLCRQMLEASGYSVAVRKPLDPLALLEQSLAATGRLEQGRCVFDRGLAPASLPRVRGVGVQLQHALAAVLLNAFESVGTGPGRVHVALHDVPLEAAPAAGLSSPVRPGRFVCFEVRDEGGGIAAESLGRIYDPFFSTKGLGRGLGLAAAAGIVRAHGGGIAVDSEPGRGAVFRVYLPACTDSAAN